MVQYFWFQSFSDFGIENKNLTTVGGGGRDNFLKAVKFLGRF